MARATARAGNCCAWRARSRSAPAPTGVYTGLTGVTVGIAYNTTGVFNAPGIRSKNATWYDGFNSFLLQRRQRGD